MGRRYLRGRRCPLVATLLVTPPSPPAPPLRVCALCPSSLRSSGSPPCVVAAATPFLSASLLRCSPGADSADIAPRSRPRFSPWPPLLRFSGVRPRYAPPLIFCAALPPPLCPVRVSRACVRGAACYCAPPSALCASPPRRRALGRLAVASLAMLVLPLALVSLRGVCFSSVRVIAPVVCVLRLCVPPATFARLPCGRFRRPPSSATRFPRVLLGLAPPPLRFGVSPRCGCPRFAPSASGER